MNPENRGQEATRPSKLEMRRKASEEGSSRNVSPLPETPAGPVYDAVPLRTAWTVDLGDGRKGTMVHSSSQNILTFLHRAPAPRRNEYEVKQRGILLIKLLHFCARVLVEGETKLLNKGLEAISRLTSDDSEEPLERLASSFADALAFRTVKPWLQHMITAPAQEAASARRHFAVMCPFLRIFGAVANHAIVDAVAVQPHRIVHVVDLGGADPDQWLQLLHLFATLSPSLILRLTIVNEEEFMSATTKLLDKACQGVGFCLVRLQIDQLTSVDALHVRSDEELVVVSTLQLHRLLADGAQQHTLTRADALLRDLRQLSPKLVVVTEQEADHNDADFRTRFQNALVHYEALFDTLEESVPARRGSAAERLCVERYLLREEMRDIVGRDGALRRERHEKVDKWAARMEAAGFTPAAAMRQEVVAHAAMLAQELLPGRAYTVVSRVNDSRLFIVYRNAIPTFSVSTWRSV